MGAPVGIGTPGLIKKRPVDWVEKASALFENIINFGPRQP
jgi:hypothetical protein